MLLSRLFPSTPMPFLLALPWEPKLPFSPQWGWGVGQGRWGKNLLYSILLKQNSVEVGHRTGWEKEK